MKNNKKKQTKKEKNKEKKIKKGTKNYVLQKNDDNNEILTVNEAENEQNKEDKKWIMLLEDQMEKYEVESSSFENANSDSEEHTNNLNESNKNTVDNITNNNKNIQMENKKEEFKTGLLTKNNILDSKNIVINNNELDIINEDNVVYDSRVFINIKKLNKNYDKRKIKKIIYKCKNNRKDEKLRLETKQNPFCEATLEYIEPGQNVKSGYFLKKNHSAECDLLEGGSKNIKVLEAKKYEEKKLFISKCEDLMNSSTIYDRRLYKESFKDIYNDKNNKFNFPLNNNFLSNIITKWKQNSYKFKKESALYEIKDKENRLLLREYRLIPLEDSSREKQKTHEYIIWANAENLMRIKVSKNIFVDSTFHHPPGFYQLMIIMYKDIITGLKIPGIYVLMNSKKEILYQYVFKSILRLISDDKQKDIKFETIVTDQETGLINVINKIFPNSLRIGCLFHYKQDILRNLKSYGLYKDSIKEESQNLLKDLGKIPFYYNGDMNIFDEECKRLKKKYINHNNFINNYFVFNKRKFFENQSLNYHNIPNDCRTNNFLENYNGYLKEKLGKNRCINWMNFLNFIKDESSRTIQKLYNGTSQNLKNKNLSEQISTVNPFNLDTKEDKNKEYIIHNEENKIYTSKEDIQPIIKSKIGLNNLGETCYMNSSIQILIHINIFIEKLISNINPFIKNLIYRLIEISSCLIKIGNKENENNVSLSYSPINFKNDFIKQYSQFSEGQHDAIEFIRTLLDNLSQETRRNKNISKYEELKLDDKTKEEQSFEYNKYFLTRENSIITDLFYTQMINIFTCKCGYESYSFQKLLDIPLLIPNETREINLYDLIEIFNNEINVHLDDICKICNKKKKNIKKKIKFNIINELIIFSVQRFDPLLSVKNESLIIYDELIDLKPYSDNPKMGKKFRI